MWKESWDCQDFKAEVQHATVPLKGLQKKTKKKKTRSGQCGFAKKKIKKIKDTIRFKKNSIGSGKR